MARDFEHYLAHLITKKPRRSFQLRLRFLASTCAQILGQNHAPELISESFRKLPSSLRLSAQLGPLAARQSTGLSRDAHAS